MRLFLPAAAAVIVCVLMIGGCSTIEPDNGTRVTLTTVGGKSMTREQIAATSQYLVRRAEPLLASAPKQSHPRIARADAKSLVLLLPGVRLNQESLARLLEPSSTELYHLKHVRTQRHPDRPWELILPAERNAPYIFRGPDSRRIESRENPSQLLSDVVQAPQEKPILTGADILPNAAMQQVRDGWVVLVEFNPAGAKLFREFTRANAGEYLAVFHNGRLLSAPLIKEPVEGNQAYITGFRSLAEARAAATDINTGRLPVPLRIKSVEHY